MAESWRKLLWLSVLCHAVGFGFLLLVSVFSFSTRTVLSEFQWAWITTRTWADFLPLVPVFQGWAVLLTFAWIVPLSTTRDSGASFERFAGSIIVLLVLTLVYAVAYLAVLPSMVARLEAMERTTTVAGRLRASADAARRERDYPRAVADLNAYLALVGRSDEVEQLLITMREQAGIRELPPAEETEQAPWGMPERATAAELLDRADAALGRSDYSTAHYMATLAQTLEPRNDEAARLATQALAGIESLAPDDRESEAARLYWAKHEAKGALTRQEYVEAYVLFATLAERHPRDTDVRRYLQTARDQVGSMAVFRDEAEAALGAPGATDLVFVDRVGPDSVHLVAIGRLVPGPAGLYAQAIESIEVDASGRVVRHVSGEYGRYADGYFLLNVVSRESGIQVRPTVLTGDEDAVTSGVLAVQPSADELWLLASVSRNPEAADIASLSRSAATAASHGLIAEPVRMELLMRLSAPFTFLSLSLLLVGFGWRYRSRYLHLPPVVTLLVIPALPFLLAPIHLGFQYAQRIAVAASLLALGLAGALVLTVALQALLLFLSLTYLALGSR